MISVLTALVALCFVAGCTVPVNALAGVGVDGKGNLVGYLHVCHDRIDGATLYYEGGSSSGSTVDVGSWEVKTPIAGTATWSLAKPASGWGTVVPLAPVTSNPEYTLYGWTKDNSWSAGSVSFTLSEVAHLQPGQVLYFSGRSGGRPERDLNEVGSLGDFETHACESTDP